MNAPSPTSPARRGSAARRGGALAGGRDALVTGRVVGGAFGLAAAARLGEVGLVAGSAGRVSEPERLVVHAARTRTAASTTTVPADPTRRLAGRSVGIFAEHRAAKHDQAHTPDVQCAAMKRLE